MACETSRRSHREFVVGSGRTQNSPPTLSASCLDLVGLPNASLLNTYEGSASGELDEGASKDAASRSAEDCICQGQTRNGSSLFQRFVV